MKLIRPLLLSALLLTGCGVQNQAPLQAPRASAITAQEWSFVQNRIKAIVKSEFQKLDTNKDGKLSKQELAKKSPLFLVSFNTVDVNMDGYVTYEEFLTRMTGNIESVSRFLFAFLDTNDDGLVTGGDYSKFLVALMDANHDRQVTFEEFQDFITSPGMINPGK